MWLEIFDADPKLRDTMRQIVQDRYSGNAITVKLDDLRDDPECVNTLRKNPYNTILNFE